MKPCENTGSETSQLEGEIIAQFREMHIDVASPDTDLIEEGLLDSLTFVDLVFRLETHYGVQVPIETVDIEDFRRVSGIAQVIVRGRAA